ncbi:MAG: hypothetical protein Q8P89_01765 [bacterium]|nr:hypothetical protein [bacterium]
MDSKQQQAVKDFLHAVLTSRTITLQNALEKILDPQAVETEINQLMGEQIKSALMELGKQKEGPIAQLATDFYDEIETSEILEAITPSLVEKLYEWLTTEGKEDLISAVVDALMEEIDTENIEDKVAEKIAGRVQVVKT